VRLKLWDAEQRRLVTFREAARTRTPELQVLPSFQDVT
jgi:hypothetical protein